jgi:hypothetical protein
LDELIFNASAILLEIEDKCGSLVDSDPLPDSEFLISLFNVVNDEADEVDDEVGDFELLVKELALAVDVDTNCFAVVVVGVLVVGVVVLVVTSEAAVTVDVVGVDELLEPPNAACKDFCADDNAAVLAELLVLELAVCRLC